MTAMRRQLGLEVIHLIAQDSLVGKNESFVQARSVGNVQKFHMCFFRSPVVLTVIAAHAACDQVGPAVVATAALGVDVVARELMTFEALTAVSADVVVTTVQHVALTKRNILALELRNFSPTNCDDALDSQGAL